MQYHIGLAKRGRTLVIQATPNRDCLSCELYDYMGEHVTTKRELRHNRYAILAHMKSIDPRMYGSLEYAAVE